MLLVYIPAIGEGKLDHRIFPVIFRLCRSWKYENTLKQILCIDNITIIILLLFGIAFICILSNKYKFPFPIAPVLCGVVISLIPGLPVIELSPEVVFIIFLPPLLYSAAWNTSWHDFKANIRPIGLAAIGLVLFTTLLVAIAAHLIIPGIDWPTAFLLGAIVSPPDPVAATSVSKGLGLHPRIIAILEGESLVNYVCLHNCRLT